MDKAEYKIRLDQMSRLAANGDFAEAAKIADAIDWKKVKSVRILCMVAEIYEKTDRLEDSWTILNYALKSSRGGKTVVYRMAELALKIGDLEEARHYCEEFERIAPHDTGRYILKYYLLKAQGASLDEQIAILKEYKDREYTERWAYELAELYKANGETEKCIEECDDLILWFSDGSYVTRAMELKMTIRPLTTMQRKLYDNRFNRAASADSAEAPEKRDNDDSRQREGGARFSFLGGSDIRAPRLSAAQAIEKMNAAAGEALNTSRGELRAPNVVTSPRSVFGTDNEEEVQQKLADSIREVFAGIRTPEEPVEEAEETMEKAIVYESPDIDTANVKALEPENFGATDRPVPAAETAPEEPAAAAAVDLNALFAETGSELAAQVVRLKENEDLIAAAAEADRAAEEAAKAAEAEAAKAAEEEAAKAAAEEAAKAAEEEAAKAAAEEAAKAAGEEAAKVAAEEVAKAAEEEAAKVAAEEAAKAAEEEAAKAAAAEAAKAAEEEAAKAATEEAAKAAAEEAAKAAEEESAKAVAEEAAKAAAEEAAKVAEEEAAKAAEEESAKAVAEEAAKAAAEEAAKVAEEEAAKAMAAEAAKAAEEEAVKVAEAEAAKTAEEETVKAAKAAEEEAAKVAAAEAAKAAEEDAAKTAAEDVAKAAAEEAAKVAEEEAAKAATEEAAKAAETALEDTSAQYVPISDGMDLSGLDLSEAKLADVTRSAEEAVWEAAAEEALLEMIEEEEAEAAEKAVAGPAADQTPDETLHIENVSLADALAGAEATEEAPHMSVETAVPAEAAAIAETAAAETEAPGNTAEVSDEQHAPENVAAAASAIAAGTLVAAAASEDAAEKPTETPAAAAAVEKTVETAAPAEPEMTPEEAELARKRALYKSLFEKETDESLGLTRPFNFQEELRKALEGGVSLQEAARAVTKKAEETPVFEDVSLTESSYLLNPETAAKAMVQQAGTFDYSAARPTHPETDSLDALIEAALKRREEEKMAAAIYEEAFGGQEDYVGEIPAELFADEEDLRPEESAAGAGVLTDISTVSMAEEETSKSLIDHIMERPEILGRQPLEPRKLDETESKLLTYFAGVPGVGDQVTVALADVHNNAGDRTSRAGNILLMGRQGAGKTRLADSIILLICKDLDIRAAKVGKIVADDLNKKDPASVVSLLAGGFLVIEGAGGMSEETIDGLNRAMEFRTDGLVVILEDEKKDLRQLTVTHPEFAAKFTSSVTVPVFTNDELVTFARTYARENGYKMDDMGTLALYTIIGQNQKYDEPVTVGKVKEMVDKAIEKANRHKLTRRLSRKAKDPSGRIYLREKDFED